MAERQIIKASFDHSYKVADSTTTLASFIEKKYRPYVEQNNVNKGAKNLYVRLLLEHFKKQTIGSISPQDCRDCRAKLQNRQNKRKKESELSPASINRIMSTLSKIFSLACEEGILERNPMQYVKALPEPPPRRRLLNEKQKEDLWTELEKDTLLYRLIVLAVNLPLRRGQLMAITEEFIDFEHEQVLVIGSKGRPPRLVPINATAAKILRTMIEDRQLPFPVKDFRKRWYTALRNAGINKKGGTREENYHFHVGLQAVGQNQVWNSQTGRSLGLPKDHDYGKYSRQTIGRFSLHGAPLHSHWLIETVTQSAKQLQGLSAVR